MLYYSLLTVSQWSVQRGQGHIFVWCLSLLRYFNSNKRNKSLNLSSIFVSLDSDFQECSEVRLRLGSILLGRKPAPVSSSFLHFSFSSLPSLSFFLYSWSISHPQKAKSVGLLMQPKKVQGGLSPSPSVLVLMSHTLGPVSGVVTTWEW